MPVLKLEYIRYKILFPLQLTPTQRNRDMIHCQCFTGFACIQHGLYTKIQMPLMQKGTRLMNIQGCHFKVPEAVFFSSCFSPLKFTGPLSNKRRVGSFPRQWDQTLRGARTICPIVMIVSFLPGSLSMGKENKREVAGNLFIS